MTAPTTEEPTPDFDEAPRSDRGIGIFLAITSSVALAASLILTNDKIELLKAEITGENLNLGCDLSAWVSCSQVVTSDQASAFGFPNSLIGIVAFSVLLTLGVVLATGISLPRWMWLSMEAGAVLGITGVTWLQYESIYQVGYLCPWCMVVWSMMIPIFVVLTARVTGSRFLKNWTVLIIALWFVAVGAAVWFEYGSRLWMAPS